MGGHSSKFKDVTKTMTIKLLTLNNITYKITISKGTYKDNDNFWVLHDSSVGTIMNMFLKIFNDEIGRIIPRVKESMNVLREYPSIFATNPPYYSIKVVPQNTRNLGSVSTNYVISYNTSIYSTKISNKDSYSLNISNYAGNYTTSETNSNNFNVFVPDFNINRNNNNVIIEDNFKYNPNVDKVFHIVDRHCKHKRKKCKYTDLVSLHNMVHVIYQELKLYHIKQQNKETTENIINNIIHKYSRFEKGAGIKLVDVDELHPLITICSKYRLKNKDVIVGFSMVGIEIKNKDPDLPDTIKEVILSVSSVPINEEEANHLHNKVYTHFG